MIMSDLVKDRIKHDVHTHDVGGQPVAVVPLLRLLDERDLPPLALRRRPLAVTSRRLFGL